MPLSLVLERVVRLDANIRRRRPDLLAAPHTRTKAPGRPDWGFLHCTYGYGLPKASTCATLAA
jgi:hypothetical protein